MPGDRKTRPEPKHQANVSESCKDQHKVFFFQFLMIASLSLSFPTGGQRIVQRLFKQFVEAVFRAELCP